MQEVLSMAPQEKALYQKRKNSAANFRTPDDDDLHDVSGITVQSARTFLRSCREHVYMGIAEALRHCPSIWYNEAAGKLICSSATSDIQHIQLRHLKILVRHVLVASVQAAAEVLPPHPSGVAGTPPKLPPWLVELIQHVLAIAYTKLTQEWAQIVAPPADNIENKQPLVNSTAGGASTNARVSFSGVNGSVSGSGAADDAEEVVSDAILREASREVLTCVLALLQYPIDPVVAKAPKSPNSEGAGVPIAVAQQTLAKPGSQKSFMQVAVEDAAQRGLAEAALAVAVQALTWPDSEVVRKACSACRFFVNAAQAKSLEFSRVLSGVVTTEMFGCAVRSYTLPAQDMHSEVLSVLRAIIMGFWEQRHAVVAPLWKLRGVG